VLSLLFGKPCPVWPKRGRVSSLTGHRERKPDAGISRRGFCCKAWQLAGAAQIRPIADVVCASPCGLTATSHGQVQSALLLTFHFSHSNNIYKQYALYIQKVSQKLKTWEWTVSKKDGKSSRKDSQLVLRLDKAERDAFVELCKELDTSAAREIRAFIRRFMKDNADQ